MSIVDKIMQVASNQPSGRNEIYFNIDNVSLNELYNKFNEIFKEKDGYYALRLNDSLLTDFVKMCENQSSLRKKMLVRLYVSNFLSSKMPNFSKTSSFIFGRPDILNNQEETLKSVKQFDILDTKSKFYIFVDGSINTIFQSALNDYIRMSGFPITIKLFTTEKVLSSYTNLNGRFIENVHDYEDKTARYQDDSRQM